MAAEDAKAEVIAALKEPEVTERINSHPKADEIKQSIKDEVKRMYETEGLHGKMVIEEFVKALHASRGRAGSDNRVNSWTAWAIGMTHKQPEGEFLEKRRAFARAGFPDIDTDFDYERRREVYDYIIERYGRENVGNIGTYGALKMRSFLRKAFKALDPDGVWQPTRQGREQWTAETRDKADQIIKSLPPQYGAVLKVKGEDGEEHAIKTVEDAYKYCRDFRYYIDQYPDLLTHSRSIEGLLSVYGVHAAGIVISDCPLDEIAPLRQTSIIKSAGDGENIEKVYEYATQFEYNDLESMGLIKFDILALSTLTVISQCISLIRENYEHLADFSIEDIPLDDQEVFELYRTGNLVGVFQCEEPGMQRTMKQIGVDCFEDIIAGVALYRPGPMEFIPQYCARKRGDERISYFHESIEPYVKKYLDETYGILCYQEQVMQVCNELAGFSITDGYGMIKAVGKKKKDILDKYEKQFVAGSKENGVDPKVSQAYWDKVIIPFADYAFNKSHSCCYGFLSYQTAYLKCHYPEEFICAYLNVELNRAKYEKIEVLEKECTDQMGIKMLARNLNKCGMKYEIVAKKDESSGVAYSQIRPPIRCKGLSKAAAEDIIENAPYKDMRDLAFKTDPKKVDTKSVESLAIAGFFRTKDEKGKKIPVEHHVNQFSGLREDMKRSRRKGVMSQDIFG
tara:strand:+ start:31918 stop:33960 length:2043 start_codon:yes stop_codon:yes gene_type:complete